MSEPLSRREKREQQKLEQAQSYVSSGHTKCVGCELCEQSASLRRTDELKQLEKGEIPKHILKEMKRDRKSGKM
jgi:hypothetical protein